MKRTNISTILTILLLYLILPKSCILFSWDEFDPMSYKIKYRNGTDDTVGIIFIPHQQDNILFILPDSNYVAEGGFGFDFEEDPVIDGLFSTDDNRFWNEISIVWNDTFKHTWYGPPREMPDSIHSFFNYNSWDVIAGPESTTGFVRFTILEADLTAN